MTDFRNEATYRAITGRSPRTESAGASWQAGMRLVVSLAGGNVSAAARALDVPRRTMRRWLAGESTPPADRRAQVARLALQVVRRDRLKPPRERRLRRAKTIVVKCRYRYDPPDEESRREIVFRIDGEGNHTSTRTDVMEQVLARYLGGAPATDDSHADHLGGLFAPIADALQDDWYSEHFHSTHAEEGFDVYEVRFK